MICRDVWRKKYSSHHDLNLSKQRHEHRTPLYRRHGRRSPDYPACAGRARASDRRRCRNPVDFVVTTKRVLMCTAGTCGLCTQSAKRCAENRGSSAARREYPGGIPARTRRTPWRHERRLFEDAALHHPRRCCRPARRNGRCESTAAAAEPASAHPAAHHYHAGACLRHFRRPPRSDHATFRTRRGRAAYGAYDEVPSVTGVTALLVQCCGQWTLSADSSRMSQNRATLAGPDATATEAHAEQSCANPNKAPIGHKRGECRSRLGGRAFLIAARGRANLAGRRSVQPWRCIGQAAPGWFRAVDEACP